MIRTEISEVDMSGITGNKRGSAAVFLAILIVTFAAALVVVVQVARELTVHSESRAFSIVWARGILSEYDLYLLHDYGLMAYQGDDELVGRKVEIYMEYSMASKLNSKLQGAEAELGGMELGDPENFRKSMKISLGMEAGKKLLSKERTKRPTVEDRPFTGVTDGTFVGGDVPESMAQEKVETVEGYRYISNPVILRTLPSHGHQDRFSRSRAGEILLNTGSGDALTGIAGNAAMDMLFISDHFGSHLYSSDGKKSYFRNEWEYVAAGKPSDPQNLGAVQRRLFLMRNAVNLAYLYTDQEKMELTLSIAEVISPGAGPAVQLILLELWASAESYKDVETLMDDGRVPAMKTRETWQTDLSGVLEGEAFRGKLGEEGRKALDENAETIGEMSEAGNAMNNGSIRDGLTYEDHLKVLILAMDEKVRLLRIMDIVQINMKYRYYRDFNMDEYYTGVRFTVKTNGRDYTVEEEYR